MGTLTITLPRPLAWPARARAPFPAAAAAVAAPMAPQAACLARCNGARVDMHRYGTFSLDFFREQIQSSCASGEEHLVVSYSRKAFLQTGDGHFSPIGGFHPERDLALILDVVRVHVLRCARVMRSWGLACGILGASSVR